MGRTQVLAVAILGAWIMSTLCMWFAATRSFSTVESVLKRAEPQFVETTKPLGEAPTRVVLRYMASEINRTLFWGYGALQIGLGAILFLLLWRQKPRNAVDIGVVAAMLALSVILTLVITPLLVSHRTEHRFCSAQSSAAGHAALLGAARVVHGTGRRKTPRRNRLADPVDLAVI